MAYRAEVHGVPSQQMAEARQLAKQLTAEISKMASLETVLLLQPSGDLIRRLPIFFSSKDPKLCFDRNTQNHIKSILSRQCPEHQNWNDMD